MAIIETRDLSFRYDEESGLALDGVNLAIEEGEFVAVLGGNGCGKSTLAKHFNSILLPVGVRANGESFYFDIHEKAHGPHGLVAGMTGSGKSEMVQSWILSMALQFSPQDVSFVLIDFKGTGLLLPCGHTSRWIGGK